MGKYLIFLKGKAEIFTLKDGSHQGNLCFKICIEESYIIMYTKKVCIFFKKSIFGRFMCKIQMLSEKSSSMLEKHEQ